MLDQEYGPELDDKRLNADEWLIYFRKDIERILRRFKGAETLSVKVIQSSEGALVLRERDPSRTKRP